MVPVKVKSGNEISIMDIVNFLVKSWKKLAAAALIGVALGMGNWFFLKQYSAHLFLGYNFTVPQSKNEAEGIDIATWLEIQKSLPWLANTILKEGKAPNNQAGIFEAMSGDQWWNKNFLVNYNLSKEDLRFFVGGLKNFSVDGNLKIIGFSISADGNSVKQAIDSLEAVTQFIVTGGSYIQLQKLLGGYRIYLVNVENESLTRIAEIKVEMAFQQQRAKNLEELIRRYPSQLNPLQQVIDLRDSGAKYLPLTTQIIAVNNEINKSKEDLKRTTDRLSDIGLLKSFLEESAPIERGTYNGLVLSDQLLKIEAKLRTKMVKDDSSQILDQIHSQIALIQSRFTNGFDSKSLPIVQKNGMLKSAIAGLLGMLFLTLILLIGQKALANIILNYKRSNVK